MEQFHPDLSSIHTQFLGTSCSIIGEWVAIIATAFVLINNSDKHRINDETSGGCK